MVTVNCFLDVFLFALVIVEMFGEYTLQSAELLGQRSLPKRIVPESSGELVCRRMTE